MCSGIMMISLDISSIYYHIYVKYVKIIKYVLYLKNCCQMEKWHLILMMMMVTASLSPISALL